MPPKDIVITLKNGRVFQFVAATKIVDGNSMWVRSEMTGKEFFCHLDDVFIIEVFVAEHERFRDEIVNIAAGGQLIPAIKRLRELTGLGLKEAKDLVYRWTGRT